MSAGAHVRSIQTLEDLKTALKRYGVEAQDALRAAEQEIRRTLHWLAERQTHWRGELRRREEMARRAEAALARCHASGHRDRDGRYHAPDCRAYERAVGEARLQLQEAEAELRSVQEWARRVQQAVAEYQREARRLSVLLHGELPKAAALLDRKVATLHTYTTTQAPSGGPLPTSSGSGSTAPLPQAIADISWHIEGEPDEIQKLQKALTRLAETKTGRGIAESIRQRATTTRFGETSAGAIAHFDPNLNEIVLHQNLWGTSPNVLAAHLAHEGTHIQWEKLNSIDQEYHAFKAQADVWDTLKGSEADDQCDWVSMMISQGERRAKRTIRRYYPDLPESAE